MKTEIYIITPWQERCPEMALLVLFNKCPVGNCKNTLNHDHLHRGSFILKYLALSMPRSVSFPDIDPYLTQNGPAFNVHSIYYFKKETQSRSASNIHENSLLLHSYTVHNHITFQLHHVLTLFEIRSSSRTQTSQKGMFIVFLLFWLYMLPLKEGANK